MCHPPVQVRGITAYRGSWEQFFMWFHDSRVFDLSELSITAGEDVAYCHGLLRCSCSDHNEGRVVLTIRLTVCYRRTDGLWTVTHEHHSAPAL